MKSLQKGEISTPDMLGINLPPGALEKAAQHIGLDLNETIKDVLKGRQVHRKLDQYYTIPKEEDVLAKISDMKGRTSEIRKQSL